MRVDPPVMSVSTTITVTVRPDFDEPGFFEACAMSELGVAFAKARSERMARAFAIRALGDREVAAEIERRGRAVELAVQVAAAGGAQ